MKQVIVNTFQMIQLILCQAITRTDIATFVKALLCNSVYDLGFRVKQCRNNIFFRCYCPLHERFMPFFKSIWCDLDAKPV